MCVCDNFTITKVSVVSVTTSPSLRSSLCVCDNLTITEVSLCVCDNLTITEVSLCVTTSPSLCVSVCV